MDYSYSEVRKIINKAQEEGSYISFIFKDNTSLTITNDTEVIVCTHSNRYYLDRL